MGSALRRCGCCCESPPRQAHWGRAWRLQSASSAPVTPPPFAVPLFPSIAATCRSGMARRGFRPRRPSLRIGTTRSATASTVASPPRLSTRSSTASRPVCRRGRRPRPRRFVDAVAGRVPASTAGWSDWRREDGRHAPYCASVTGSSHSTALPSFGSWIAIWVIAVAGAAPCQCFSPGANQTTSPGRISSIGPPSR